MSGDAAPRLFQLPKTETFRVSVCRLEDDAWREQGLGLVSCERRDKDGQTWLIVQNEKKPGEVLVRCLVKAPLSFRKQDSLLFCAAPQNHITINTDVATSRRSASPEGDSDGSNGNDSGKDNDSSDNNNDNDSGNLSDNGDNGDNGDNDGSSSGSSSSSSGNSNGNGNGNGGAVVRLALCFQELAGCATICDFLIQAAHSWSPGVTMAVQYASADISGEVDLELVVQQPPLPPLPTSENVESVLRTISQALRTPLGREFLSVYLDQTHYLNHMYDLFVKMELDSELSAVERIRTLWALSDIMKQYFLVGDGYLIDSMVRSDQFVKVIGILEYDRAFGTRKANFRDYYCNHTELKQVIEINDTPVLEKIRRTFRLQLMRDILVRSADDFPFQILKTLIYINQVDIIDSLQNSTTFCDDLFGLFDESDTSLDVSEDGLRSENHQNPRDLRQQGLKFINEVIKVSRTFTMHQMRVLYENLTDYGLFEVLNYAMDDDQPIELKVLALESLGVLMDFDPQLAARHFVPTIEKLTQLICESQRLPEFKQNPGMVSAMQIQACELLKKLMTEEPRLTVETFLKQVARHLPKMTSEPSAQSLQHIFDIISFSYARVPAKTLQIFIEHGLWSRLASAIVIKTGNRDKTLDSGVLLALSRAVQHALQPNLVNESDGLVTQSKQLVETELIGIVLDLMSVLGNANQMVHSSGLSLLNLIVEGSRKGEPQFHVITRWIAHERGQDIQKLSRALPTFNEIRELADDDDDGSGSESRLEEDKQAGEAQSSSTLKNPQQGNRKRPTSSDTSLTPKAQRPRVHLNVSLQQSQQHAPIDEVDSGEMQSSSLLGQRHSDEQSHSAFLDEGQAPFVTSSAEHLERAELGTDYLEDISPSPTSPTAANYAYWNQPLIASGSGTAKRRAMFLQEGGPRGRGSSDGADLA